MIIHDEISTHVLIDVWEVYERDNPVSVSYISEKLAKESTFFEEIDLVAPSRIWVDLNFLEDFCNGEPLV